MPLFPLVLVAHVALAVALLLPSVLLPFAMRVSTPDAGASGRPLRGLIELQTGGTPAIGIGLVVTGLLLIGFLGPGVLSQPWLLVALVIYTANLGLAFVVARPNLRRLLVSRGDRADALWRARARQQRYVSYVMAGLVGVIGWLMSAKPALW